MARVNGIDWLAGILDVTGTATICGDHPRLALKLADEEIVRAVAEIAGCGRVYGPYAATKGTLGTKPAFMWVAQGDEARELGQRLLPLLHSDMRTRVERTFAL